MPTQTSRVRLILNILILAVSALVVQSRAVANSGLQVIYGSNGIQQLIYNGVVLEDLGQYPSDAFHIWHLSSTDLEGNALSSGQYGWGEVNNGRSWNAATATWTYSFVWGSITVQFVQSGNTLNMNVTETNNADSGIVFDGSNIYPLVLHFPTLPSGFTNASYAQVQSNITGPSVTLADFGSGEVTAVDAEPVQPLYSGYYPGSITNSYTAIIGSTTISGLADFFPIVNRPLQPGQTDTYTVSLRFAPSGTATSGLASDAYTNWNLQWPRELSWLDHRAIGTVYLASSPQGNPNQPGGFPNNPRRYYGDSNPSDFDITTTAGLAAFQARIIQQALSNVQNANQMGAQGVITWDIEGEEYPQPTSYVCEPDEIAQEAPEMESVISNSQSPYAGMKLDDAYFSIMRQAGLRLGVCVRPQHFTINSDGTADQVTLPDGQVVAELVRKMQYAHDRWGVTLFYIDSNVDANGETLDAGIFQQVAATFPDSLVMPEHSTPKYYAYTAPFLSFLANTTVSTPPEVRYYYPYAFSVNLVNDVDASTLAENVPALTTAVAAGDILMAHVDYWQANDPTIVQIYQNAGVGAPLLPRIPPADPPTVQTITTVGITNGQVLTGSVPVSAQTSAALGSGGVVLTVDGQPIISKSTESPYLFSVNTADFIDGWHVLQAVGQDANHNTLLSPAVEVVMDGHRSRRAAKDPRPPRLRTFCERSPGRVSRACTAPVTRTSE